MEGSLECVLISKGEPTATEPFTDWMPTYFSQKARGGNGNGGPTNEAPSRRPAATRSPAPKSLTPKGRVSEGEAEDTFSSFKDGAGSHKMAELGNRSKIDFQIQNLRSLL